MKVYSPSSTLTFQRCPQLWVYHKEGLRPKTIGAKQIAANIGIAIGKGLEWCYKGNCEPDALVVANHALRDLFQVAIDAGAYVLPRHEGAYEVAGTRVNKALRRFFKEQPFPRDWKDFRPEIVFPDHGNCRVDLLFNSDNGPCILDFKTKVACPDYRVDEFIFDFETSWQMHHYVWAGRQMGMVISSFALCLIIIEPFECHVRQWVVDEDALDRWERDAYVWWQLMEEVETGFMHPMRVGDHRDKYGLCEAHGLCYGSPLAGFDFYTHVRA